MQIRKMKSIAISALFIWLIAGCSGSLNENSSFITFSIKGGQNDTIRLWQNDPLTLAKINPHEIILDKYGVGSIEIIYPDTSFLYLKIRDHVFPLINVKGSNICIKGNVNDLSNTIRISGINSIPNKYLLLKEAIIKKYEDQGDRLNFKLDSIEFQGRIRTLDNEIDSLNRWLVSRNIDHELESLLCKESQQISDAYKLNYALAKGYDRANFPIDIQYDKNLLLSYSAAYSMVLFFNFSYELLGPLWINSGASKSDSIAYVFPQIFADALDTMTIPDYAKDYYLATLLHEYFGGNQSNPAVEEVFSEWRAEYPNSKYWKTVSDDISAMSNLAPGTPAPIITGIDQFGKAFSLEQYKGHYIYIDVWATWCSPCREKIPKMCSLQEEFGNNSMVKILFVSVDTDLDKWQDFIAELPEKGIHINVNI